MPYILTTTNGNSWVTFSNDIPYGTTRSVAEPRCLPRIPDPTFQSWIPDPGLTRSRIPDRDLHQRIEAFLAQKTATKFSKIRSRKFIRIPDPGSVIFSIPDPGRDKKAPDPGSGAKTLTARLTRILI
jgi:hypothetical protein